jgi:hypothetical protein
MEPPLELHWHHDFTTTKKFYDNNLVGVASEFCHKLNFSSVAILKARSSEALIARLSVIDTRLAVFIGGRSGLVENRCDYCRCHGVT